MFPNIRPLVVSCLVAPVLFGGCATLDVQAPPDVDLGGEWMLDASASGEAPDLDAIRRRADRELMRGKAADPATSATFVVQDFPVLAAKRLRIEQDVDSMGVYYDEGGYRDVSWGERVRDLWTVRAGWSQGALVVRSSRGPTRGTETYTLEQNGRQLRVAVTVRSGDEQVAVERVYRRQ